VQYSERNWTNSSVRETCPEVAEAVATAVAAVPATTITGTGEDTASAGLKTAVVEGGGRAVDDGEGDDVEGVSNVVDVVGVSKVVDGTTVVDGAWHDEIDSESQ
jgi:hypothetical protein